MIESLEYHPAADAELTKVLAWYVQRDERNKATFLADLREATGRLLTHPQAFALDKHDTRHCRLKRFPYSIVFKAYDTRIVVYAIAPDRRRPGDWRRRLGEK